MEKINERIEELKKAIQEQVTRHGQLSNALKENEDAIRRLEGALNELAQLEKLGLELKTKNLNNKKKEK